MKNICWIRRDLRLHDHLALASALEAETTLVFIFDEHILNKLKDKNDRRVTFIMQSLQEMERKLQTRGSSLLILYGKPEIEIPKIAKKLNVISVYANRDYEPYAKSRDENIGKKLKTLGIDFKLFKDHVFFEQHEVLKDDGEVYQVFTPYKNKWLHVFEKQDRTVPQYKCHLKNLRKFKNDKNVLNYNWYKKIGFIETPPLLKGGTSLALKRLKKFKTVINDYQKARDYPAIDGTSLLSVYIRHGNISIRDMVRVASEISTEGSRTWLGEIIWRDFYQMILDTHPKVEKVSLRPEYDLIKWWGNEKDFKAWCEGETGFPIIDAAMRCFNQTGMMHNRLRMVVASFLCKTLLVNWRKGEKYFADILLDFDLGANNGGWQWSAGSGSDAQPYFRIFNPYTQSKKFDPEGTFIRTWVPELASLPSKDIHRPDPKKAPDYPLPIVSYEENRRRCLSMYSVVKKK